MKPSEAMYAAADYIRKHGWIQGRVWDDKGRCCMVGAVIEVTTSIPLRHRISRHLRHVCGVQYVSRFNDLHCKTKNDAIAALEIAADIAAASGE